MKFKVGDKVKFDTGVDDCGTYQNGIGVIVDIDVSNGVPYLIHSEDIEGGHSGVLINNDEFKQDNDNNWWFTEDELELVESCNDTDENEECQSDCNEYVPFKELLEKLSTQKNKLSLDEVDMVNEPLHYNLGEIQTLDYIDDVLVHNKELSALEGYYIGNILKYLGTRLGTKGDKLEDMKKAQFYLNRLINKGEEK